ncbi:hypothetical protein ACDX78_10445 [Virgibacillus oceani]
MHNQTKVLLPEWIWEQPKNKEELKGRILQYMQRYKGYTVLKVKGRFAICEIGR